MTEQELHEAVCALEEQTKFLLQRTLATVEPHQAVAVFVGKLSAVHDVLVRLVQMGPPVCEGETLGQAIERRRGN